MRVIRRRLAVIVAAVVVCVAAVALAGLFARTDDHRTPSVGSLAGLSMRERIAAIATSQDGYRTNPVNSYCNKFSAHWGVGNQDCPSGETSEEWCADFAAWVWQTAGARFSYGYGPGQINAGAISFYAWGVAHGHWHPVASAYVPSPGDVAVYGLSLGTEQSAAHVAVVTRHLVGQRGPDVINGDGDRTGFSVVEAGEDQIRADSAGGQGSVLAGYVSPP